MVLETGQEGCQVFSLYCSDHTKWCNYQVSPTERASWPGIISLVSPFSALCVPKYILKSAVSSRDKIPPRSEHLFPGAYLLKPPSLNKRSWFLSRITFMQKKHMLTTEKQLKTECLMTQIGIYTPNFCWFVKILCTYVYIYIKIISEKSLFEKFIVSEGVQKCFGNIWSSCINTFSRRMKQMPFFNWKETFHLQGLVNVYIYINTQKSSKAARNSSKLCIKTATINFHNWKIILMACICVQHIFYSVFCSWSETNENFYLSPLPLINLQ